jgi:hypothetical protein
MSWAAHTNWTGCLWLLTAALSVGLALEVEHALTWQPPATDAAAKPQPPLSFKHGDAPAIEPAESIQTILARPIFAPSRRPPAVVVAQAIAPPAVAKLPRLTGVVTSPSDRRALFAAAEGEVMEVAEGSSIGDYVVRSISPNEVVLAGPGGERELHPSSLKIIPHVIHALQEASAQ